MIIITTITISITIISGGRRGQHEGRGGGRGVLHREEAAPEVRKEASR